MARAGQSDAGEELTGAAPDDLPDGIAQAYATDFGDSAKCNAMAATSSI
jgi:hypothetical protein